MGTAVTAARLGGVGEAGIVVTDVYAQYAQPNQLLTQYSLYVTTTTLGIK